MAKCNKISDVVHLKQKDGVKIEVTNSKSMDINNSENTTAFPMPQSQPDGEELTGEAYRYVKESVTTLVQSKSTPKSCYNTKDENSHDYTYKNAIELEAQHTKNKYQSLITVELQNYNENSNKPTKNLISQLKSTTEKSCQILKGKNGCESTVFDPIDLTVPHSNVEHQEVGGEELQCQKADHNKVKSNSPNVQSSTLKCFHETMNKNKYNYMVETTRDMALAQSKTAIDFARSHELSSDFQNYSESDNNEATDSNFYKLGKNKSSDESNDKIGYLSNIHNRCDFTIPEGKAQCMKVGNLKQQNQSDGILTITYVELISLTVKSCCIPVWGNDCDSILNGAVEYFMSQRNGKRQEHSGVKKQNYNNDENSATIKLSSSEKFDLESKDKNDCAISHNNEKFHELAGVGLNNYKEVNTQLSNTVAFKSSTVKSYHPYMEKYDCDSTIKSINQFTMPQNNDACQKLSSMELQFYNDNSTIDSATDFILPQSVDTNEEINKMRVKSVEVRSSSVNVRSCHKTNIQNWDDRTNHSAELRTMFKKLGIVLSTVTLEKKSNYCLHETTSSCQAMLRISSSLISHQLVCTSFLMRRRVSNIPTQAKAKRIKFYRNGDEYAKGIVIPVSKKKYSTLEKLLEDLTRKFFHYNCVASAIAKIYTMCGKPIKYLNELENLHSYVCTIKNERFKPASYKESLQLRISSEFSVKANNNHSKRKSSINMSLSSCFLPPTVTLIKGGFKPRMIMQFVPNAHNCSTFEKVVQSISNLFGFASKRVPKVYSLSGVLVSELADFIEGDCIFFVFLKKPVSEDFLLHPGEIKYVLRNAKKPLKSAAGSNMLEKDELKRTDCIDTSSKTYESNLTDFSRY